ncbi:DUF4197 domain-containing protein [Marinobacterium rhizophilum]|uniref:DUF4197 domain-containing protein n=1 Tax=Marinobacterium rhizophilum TaxID=420402 RepID=A0ABY5HMT6_9GAMM|nr:DUF4197 domain-containing protein [Marinobacterium rhizophilum]UTW12903.1 DUF4197 domain-containing protein [Marinobacterium rhizophilum]
MTHLRFLSTPILVASLFGASMSTQADWKDVLNKAQETITQGQDTNSTSPTDAAISGLSSSDITGGLKEALIQGSRSAVESLGTEGGFLDNPAVRIPLPSQLQLVEKGLRVTGQGALADNFITSMNRAAEQAVPLASDLFVDTIREMSVEDARGILQGPDDAATAYLRAKNGDKLNTLMRPIVAEATDKVGVTSAYKNMSANAGMLGTVPGLDALDLDTYVTEQATDGLFAMIAAEEKRIRENPVARSTDLLKKVFSSAM